jgi:excisionase family DNA binding protein
VSPASSLDDALREMVRQVVREEIRAALDDDAARTAPRNALGEDGYLSIAAAAAYAAVAPGTLRRWIRSGRLPVHRAGRVYRIGRLELEDFLTRQGPSAAVVAQARAILRDAA